MVDWLAASLIVAGVVAFVPLPSRPRQTLSRPFEGRTSAAVTPSSGAAAPVVGAHATAPPTTTPSSAGQPGIGQLATGRVIECVDLAKQYGGVRALDGVSLGIDAGELVGLVGPNGSGKSTLIGLLSGALRPTSGTIHVVGQPVAALAPHEVAHLGIARTYQIPRPFASMTVRDNVAMASMFGRHAVALEDARERAGGYLAMVGLEGRADVRPSGINLHQRQLLEMARALATDPQVLLLDEALAGLNPTEIDQAVEVVRRIHASGVTIVIVEHLLRVVNQLATRIVVLDRGRLLAAGEPGTVMRDPAVVHAYLGRLADA
jgi:branched-chain amino acid transport system permease protein